MLKLKRYSFSGIGRFVEKQTIDLESRDHLIQIDGENTNTGGSSGAGKSTTVEALAFLLGISDIPSTQLQSRITKSPIWVQGEFEGGITITRSKKDGLTVETPDGTVSGNSKLAEEKLDEIIGVNRGLLKTMCYKRQKQGGFFLNLTPKESHGFLIDCLDLSKYQDKINELQELVKEKYKPKKIELESKIQMQKATINDLGTLLEQRVEPQKPELFDVNLKNTEKNILEQKLESEKKKYDEMVAKLGPKPIQPEAPVFDKDEDLQLIQSQIVDLDTIMKANAQKHQESIEQAHTALNKIESNISRASGYKKVMIEDKESIDRIKESIAHIENKNCPTCMRDWSGKDLDKKLFDLKEQQGMLEDNVANYRREIEQIPHLIVLKEKAEEIIKTRKNEEVNTKELELKNNAEAQLRVLLNEKDNLKSSVEQKYLKEVGQWNELFNFLDQTYKKTENDLKNKTTSLQHEIDTIALKEKSYQESLDNFKKDCKNLTDSREKNQKELMQKAKELDLIEKNTVLSEESIRLIRNYTLQKFQDTLDYIGARATEIINMIPNMTNAVIFFEGAKETKTGKIKNEVNAVINLEGDSNIPVRTLSGGERTSADFAVDLAVGEMIENMTQKGVNFLVIDEGFDGLDSVSKIECLEILKTLNTEKKILMVDHSSEVKEMVCDIIKVKRINEESYVL